MEALGFPLREEAVLHALTEEVLKSSEIEGEVLDREQVRYFIARRLGMDIGGLVEADRNVEGIVEMMLDATQNYTEPLTAERLFGWHAALFPTGRSGMSRITVGAWRTAEAGPMQFVSGPIGRERVYFEAPESGKMDAEMSRFLVWFETATPDPVLKAGLAHLWFVTVHPFDDGNGRIARAIADLALARAIRPLPSSNGWTVTNHRCAIPAFKTGSGVAVSNQSRKRDISASIFPDSGASK